ncbi:helix-turn-helix domain-containing protein [Streptomyces pseudovenezuelae]|uniref:helix-turn-helix domain-containing protein n=1 Tax=Streptomyces pseudovenezuelae TaxID=67350 RepID=UPI0036EF1417
MIRNDRQLAIGRRKLSELQEAAKKATGQEQQVWLRLAQEVLCEVDEYEAIKRGQTVSFEVKSLDDIPAVLTKARIAGQLTQAELAARLDVSEQMVQKDEAGAYETARLDRLADVSDALGYELVGVFQPAGARVFAAPATSTVQGFSPSQNVHVNTAPPFAVVASTPVTVATQPSAIILKGNQ